MKHEKLVIYQPISMNSSKHVLNVHLNIAPSAICGVVMTVLTVIT